MTNIFNHGYAVVIGVDENNLKRLALPAVAKDVQAVHDVLIHPERCAYDPDNVKLLMGEKSTSRNILDALYWLEDKVKKDPDATAVIYYSGHGMVDTEAGQYYLIPFDIRSLSRIRGSAIKAEELTATISEIQAKRMLVILDCCHAAGMDIKDVDLTAISQDENVESRPFPIDLPDTKDIPAYKAAPGSKAASDLLDGQGRAILNSSTGAQSSYVRQDRKMSLFTYHLIEALSGHAPHPDDATVVYVTDVMSWVTHEVKKSAAREGVNQTPVMRTSGVFPVAQLIGGKGLSLAKGDIAPDPLAELPPVGTTVTFHQEGQTVEGDQINIAGDANIGQIGDTINTGGGDYVGRDKIGGDKIGGDKIEGDEITVGSIVGTGAVAIGRGAQASVTNESTREEQNKAISQARRFQVATPEIAKIGQPHELMAMVALAQGPGLRALLPKTTAGDDIINEEDMRSQTAEINFPSKTEPVSLFIEIEASKKYFEIDEPRREIMVYPDEDSSDEIFYLEPLRITTRAAITVRLLDERNKRMGYIRLEVQIEQGESQQVAQAAAFQISPVEIMRLFSQSAVNVNYNVTNVGSITSSSTAIGSDSSAQTQK